MTKKSSVAEYINALIAVSDKTQAQLADETGFAANMLPMIKTGKCKLPVDKVFPLAIALGIEPKELARRVLKEYQPGLWSMIEESFGTEVMVSQQELSLLEVIRVASGDYLPDVSDSAVAQIFADATKEAVKVTKGKDKAAVDRYNREPARRKHSARTA